MLIYKRQRVPDDLKAGAPPGTVFEKSDSGWMTSEIFVKWLQHFIDTINPNTDRKVLLILDGHSSHTKNLKGITLARDNGVVMLCLPPHTTHRLQPLDVSFFKPLSVFYNQAGDTWLRKNPDCNITQGRVAEILGESYGKAATVQNAINGFAKTGICPLNPFVFDDSDFIRTAQLGVLEERVESQESQETSAHVGGSSSVIVSPSTSHQNNNTSISNLGTHSSFQKTDLSTSNPKIGLSVAEISPVPMLKARKRKISRKSASTLEITSTPYKNYLETKDLKKKLRK